jgi:pimeloyl-ACP methyl ester carboxylesterase
MALTGSLLSTLATARSWSSTDFREEMKAIEIPILVIHGTADKTVPIEVSGRRSAALLAHGILSEYEGEPHGLFLTAADRLNDELVRFTKE